MSGSAPAREFLSRLWALEKVRGLAILDAGNPAWPRPAGAGDR